MSVTFEEQEKNNPRIHQETVCDAKHILSTHLKNTGQQNVNQHLKRGREGVDKKKILPLFQSNLQATPTQPVTQLISHAHSVTFLVSHAQLAVIHVLRVLYFPPLCPLDRSDISCWWSAIGPHMVCETGACMEVAQETKRKENQNLANNHYLHVWNILMNKMYTILSHLP